MASFTPNYNLDLYDYIHHCVHAAARSGDTEELDRKMDEIMAAVKRLMK